MTEIFNPINIYFQTIRKLKVLKEKEFLNLLKKTKKGDLSAKQKIVEGNLRLVIPIAKKYYRDGIDFSDLIEEGNLGLIRAIEKFDPKKEIKFSTYAAYWIEQAIRKSVEQQSRMIRIPIHVRDEIRKWLRIWQEFIEKFDREPSLSEIAKKMNLSIKKLKRLMDVIELSKSVASLDGSISSDENILLKDQLSEAKEVSPQNLILGFQISNELENALKQLNKRDRAVIKMHYGLETGKKMTLEEIGKKLKISRERVRQLEQRAIKKLQKYTKKFL